MSLLTPQTRTLVVSAQVAAYNEQPPTKLIPSNSWPAVCKSTDLTASFRKLVFSTEQQNYQD